ncbi:MAG: archaetidylinositol phosphate synthase [Candidatus Hadarchaeales archaeon]
MLSRIKKEVGRWMEPLASSLARGGITPNLLTLLGLGMGLVSALFFALGKPLEGGLLLLLCGFFDLLDGAVARSGGKETKFGGVLDSVVDRYVDFLILLAIIWGGLAEAFGISGLVWGGAAILGSFMVSYVRARGEAAGTGKMEVGLAERGERILLLGLGSILGFTNYAVVLVAVLSHFTVVQRMVVAKRRLGG